MAESRNRAAMAEKRRLQLLSASRMAYLTNDLGHLADNEVKRNVGRHNIRVSHGEAGIETAACGEGGAQPVINFASPRNPTLPPIQQDSERIPERKLVTPTREKTCGRGRGNEFLAQRQRT